MGWQWGFFSQVVRILQQMRRNLIKEKDNSMELEQFVQMYRGRHIIGKHLRRIKKLSYAREQQITYQEWQESEVQYWEDENQQQREQDGQQAGEKADNTTEQGGHDKQANQEKQANQLASKPPTNRVKRSIGLNTALDMIRRDLELNAQDEKVFSFGYLGQFVQKCEGVKTRPEAWRHVLLFVQEYLESLEQVRIEWRPSIEVIIVSEETRAEALAVKEQLRVKALEDRTRRQAMFEERERLAKQRAQERAEARAKRAQAREQAENNNTNNNNNQKPKRKASDKARRTTTLKTKERKPAGKVKISEELNSSVYPSAGSAGTTATSTSRTSRGSRGSRASRVSTGLIGRTLTRAASRTKSRTKRTNSKKTRDQDKDKDKGQRSNSMRGLKNKFHRGRSSIDKTPDGISQSVVAADGSGNSVGHGSGNSVGNSADRAGHRAGNSADSVGRAGRSQPSDMYPKGQSASALSCASAYSRDGDQIDDRDGNETATDAVTLHTAEDGLTEVGSPPAGDGAGSKMRGRLYGFFDSEKRKTHMTV